MPIKLIIIFFVSLAFISTSHLQHTSSDGITCDCMKSTRCKHWLSAVSSGKYLQLPICGYDTHSLHPLLCCPRDEEAWLNINRIKRDVQQGQKNIQLSCSITSQTLTPAEVATNKCNEYSKAVLSVFEVSVGDDQYKKVERDTCLKNDEGNAEPREFPHMALVGYDDKDSISWACGGVLISERYVLTAAHCASNRWGDKEVQWVKLGEFDFSTDEDVAKPVIYKVFQIIKHPDYLIPLLDHDIALLKLNKDVEFNIFIRPACLFTKRDSPDDKAFAVGYGRKKIDGISCDCMKPMRCNHWLSAVNSGTYLQLPVCGFDTHSLLPLLCCPKDEEWMNKVNRSKREVLLGQKNVQLSCTITSQTLTPAEVAINKCNEYSKAVLRNFEVSVGDGPYHQEKRDTCLKNDARNTEPREFPHMALIGFDEDDTITWLCGGILISERYILTAGHCINSRQHGLANWVKLGEFDISTDEDVAKPIVYKIFERIAHPDYKPPLKYNDIALLKLNKDVEFSIFIRPACLFTKRDSPDDIAFAIGYGQTIFAGDRSQVPKKVVLDIVSLEKCKLAYGITESRQLPQGIHPDSMICALEKNQTHNLVCAGDSGGPLQIPLKKPYCMYGIIGITSFGKACGFNVPGVNTRVSHYVPWIVQNVWPDDLEG